MLLFFRLSEAEYSVHDTLNSTSTKYSQNKRVRRSNSSKKFIDTPLDKRKSDNQQEMAFKSEVGEGRQSGIAGVDYDTIYLSIGNISISCFLTSIREGLVGWVGLKKFPPKNKYGLKMHKIT